MEGSSGANYRSRKKTGGVFQGTSFESDIGLRRVSKRIVHMIFVVVVGIVIVYVVIIIVRIDLSRRLYG